MSKRARVSGGGGDEDEDDSFDPMAFYRQQQQAMLSQAAQHVEQSRDEITRAQQVGNPLYVYFSNDIFAFALLGTGTRRTKWEKTPKKRRHGRQHVAEVHVGDGRGRGGQQDVRVTEECAADD